MAFTGRSVARRDAVDKVLGRAAYVDDVDAPGMWHGAVVRSEVPHARINGVRLDPAFDWGSVVTAGAQDIPGKNCVAMIEQDLPLIASDVTRHVGEAVLLIAAPTRELALAARAQVEVDYEEVPSVLTLDESKRASVRIAGGDNVVARYEITKGDAAAALEGAEIVVEGTYETGHQEHIYIENQGMIASWTDDGLSVEGSLQCPYYVSKALAVLMGLPEDRISVKQSTVGGAFGGKEDYPSVLAGYCSVLSRKCGRPVKIVYDRDEDIRVTTKRHPARVTIRTGADRKGRLEAIDISYELDAGAYVTLTPVVLSRGVIHSPGPYRCDNVRARAAAYATNTPPNGAFRGFGAPQAFFPLEVHMDRVARAVGMAPIEFRRINCLRRGDRTATGQLLKDSVGSELVLEEALRRSKVDAPRRERGPAGSDVRRGMGVAFFMHGAGFTGSGEATLKGEATLRLTKDGRVEILTACTEMGQGSHTVIPQMVADFLGVDLDLIDLPAPDTACVPDSGPTVASRTTMIMGAVLGKCAAKVKGRLEKFAKARHGKGGDVPVEKLIGEYVAEEGELAVTDHYEMPEGLSWDEKSYKGDAYPVYSWGCDVAEVEVDMDTFEYRVLKMWLVQDLGRAINPKLAEGQIEGGSLQAMGWATMENQLMKGGRVQTDRLSTYVIPTSVDAPEMETVIVEANYGDGPMGAKGVGELPMDGGAPAIANAIFDATGVLVTSLPITPEKIYEGWKDLKGGAKG